MMDWWQDLLKFGEGALEEVGEGIGQFADSYIDFQAQSLAEKRANVNNAREAEPVKGRSVEGRPIVVDPTSSGVDTQTLLLVGGGILAAVAVAMIVKG